MSIKRKRHKIHVDKIYFKSKIAKMEKFLNGFKLHENSSFQITWHVVVDIDWRTGWMHWVVFITGMEIDAMGEVNGIGVRHGEIRKKTEHLE